MEELKAELEALLVSLRKALEADAWVEQYEIAKKIQRVAFKLYLLSDDDS